MTTTHVPGTAHSHTRTLAADPAAAYRALAIAHDRVADTLADADPTLGHLDEMVRQLILARHARQTAATFTTTHTEDHR